MNDLKYRHTGKVINGRIEFDNDMMYRREMAGMDKKRVVVIFYQEDELIPIGKDDLSYYFAGVIHEFSRCDYFLDKSKDEIHHFLMSKFWGERQIKDGIEKIFVPSISKFNKHQFNEHLMKVCSFAAELGIAIKERGEYYSTKRFKMT